MKTYSLYECFLKMYTFMSIIASTHQMSQLILLKNHRSLGECLHSKEEGWELEKKVCL